ncbi:MAG: hypothetical protein ACI86H_003034 [bacterium]|jgi:hypothetical protein
MQGDYDRNNLKGQNILWSNMSLNGKISACLGKDCPTPCCQDDVHIWPEEKNIVLGEEEFRCFTGDLNQAKNDTKKIHLNSTQSYIKHCFCNGCKLENNNPEDSQEKPQKGVACIAFPIYATNQGGFSKTVIRLAVVTKDLCPLVKTPEIIQDHLYKGLIPVIQQRFPQVEKIEFESLLEEIIGKE